MLKLLVAWLGGVVVFGAVVTAGLKATWGDPRSAAGAYVIALACGLVAYLVIEKAWPMKPHSG